MKNIIRHYEGYSEPKQSRQKANTPLEEGLEHAGCDEDDTNYSPAKEPQIILCQAASSFCVTRG